MNTETREPLIKVTHLKKYFPLQRKKVLKAEGV